MTTVEAVAELPNRITKYKCVRCANRFRSYLQPTRCPFGCGRVEVAGDE
jgi:hypothetical protein